MMTDPRRGHLIHHTTPATKRHPRLARACAAVCVLLAAVLLGVWVAPRASGSAAAWLRTPSVTLKTLRPGGGELAVARTSTTTASGRGSAAGAGAPATLDAGMQFTMVGVVCDAAPTGAVRTASSAGAVTIRLRTSPDGEIWSRWYAAQLEAADEPGSTQVFTDPVWTGDARYVQVAAVAGSRRAPQALTGVRLVAIDPTEDSSVAARALGAVRRVAATVAGVSFDQPAAAASTQPAIVTRAEWGADEKLRSGSPSYSPVKMAIIHHTASTNDYSQADAPAFVRGIYAYHTKSLGWSDIGYNFLIDRFGTIYEGRYGGVARGVVGAQAGGFNTGSTGISVLGTFTDVAPPAVTITALERLLAWKLGVSGVDPMGTATLTCGLTDKYKLGQSVTFPAIVGHRDVNYTECPGDAFYALLPAIRANVAKRMGDGGGTTDAKLSADHALISPNGDGVLDAVDFSVAVTAPADWRLVVRDASGGTVASWSGSDQTATVSWDGTSDGKTVPDGDYTAELTAGADVSSAPVSVTVDTAAPRLATAAAAPRSFSPNGDGQADTTTVTYSPEEPCSIRVGILDADSTVVRWLQGWRADQAQEYTASWDGRVTSGAGLIAAADGQYRFVIERRDAGGNIARRGIPIVVDRTVGFPAATPAVFSPNGDGVADSTQLAFRLTRTASVTVQVSVGGQVVRTLGLGSLAAGARSVTWDGKTGSGDSVANGRPTFTVTASSTLGDSSVTGQLTVDLYPPRVYAPAGKVTKAGAKTKLGFKVADPFSATADVRYAITDAKGRTVASGHPGSVATGKGQSVTWRPTARGVYTVSWHAIDLAGNHEAVRATTRITVH